LLIVQHGPGFPLLHEVKKFRRRLDLERDYLVVYWEQRGCGDAPADEARRVALAQQVDDLQAGLSLAIALAGHPSFTTTATVSWIAHIAFDHALGFGLKLTTSFEQTALGPIGRSHREQRTVDRGSGRTTR